MAWVLDGEVIRMDQATYFKRRAKKRAREIVAYEASLRKRKGR